METNLDGAVLSRIVRGRAERVPDRVVLAVDDGTHTEHLTAGDLHLKGNQMATVFAAAGLADGAPVAVMTNTCPELLYALVATSRLGLPTVPIDPRTGPDALAAILNFAGCSAILVEDTVLADEAVAAVIDRCGVRSFTVRSPEGRAGGLTGSGGGPPLEEILAGAEAADPGERVNDLAAPWLLSFTHGTRKDPKALLVEHGRQVSFRQVPGHLGYRPDDVAYTALPVLSGHALLGTVLPALRGTIDRAVLSRRMSTSRLWDLCIEHDVTTWSTFGDMASAVYNESNSDRDRAHRVRLVVSVGMPREIWRAFEQRFGVRVLEWYGTLHGGFACNPAGVGPVGSFGKPPVDLVMDVIDDAGDPVPAGSIGELILRPAGSEARVRYLKDPEASARAVQDGWLHTGDLVTRDANGWLYFVASDG